MFHNLAQDGQLAVEIESFIAQVQVADDNYGAFKGETEYLAEHVGKWSKS